MRVVFDATALGSGLGGDETYLTGALEGLALAAGPDDTFPLLLREGADVPATIAGDARFGIRRIARRPGLTHYLAGLPFALARERGRADLVHTITHAPIPALLPTALTVGDLSFVHRPGDYPRSTRRRLATLVPRQARAARVVLTPSEYSRHDLIATYGLDPDRVFVVPNRVAAPVALEPTEADAARAWCAARGLTEPFVLYLGNVHPRKNLDRVVAAFAAARRDGALADHQLVIAGGSWFGAGIAAGGSMPAWLVQLGRVSDPTRRWLLGAARALAYVSLFEGFGVPPIEAMAAGTPVLASNVTAVPEVCGAAAHLVDPTDIDAIADGLAAVSVDSPERTALIERGHARAERFTSAATGRHLWHALQAATADRPTRADPHAMTSNVR